MIQLTISSTPCKASVKPSLLERVQFVTTTLLLSVAIPVSLSLFIVAGVIDTVRWRLNPNLYECLEGARKEKTGSPKTIVTWNICAFFLGGGCLSRLEAGQEASAVAMRVQQVREILKMPPNILLGDMNERLSETALLQIYQNPSALELE